VTLSIRHAQPDDLGLVLQFIKELAAYEKLSDEVVASEAILRQSLFAPGANGEAIIAEVDGVGVGFALFFHNFSTFLGRKGLYLEDLFVKPEVRSKGYGKEILKYLAKLAIDRGCGRFEWWVLDWNKAAIGFYEKIGAKAMDEWTVYRMDESAMKDFIGAK
jgi:GNAT superfamily N-acetyltransferase